MPARPLFAAAAALLLAGCSTPLCQRLEGAYRSLDEKSQGCPGQRAKSSFDAARCEGESARCTAEDLRWLEEYARCLKEVPACVNTRPLAFHGARAGCLQVLTKVRLPCALLLR